MNIARYWMCHKENEWLSQDPLGKVTYVFLQTNVHFSCTEQPRKNLPISMQS